MKGWEDVTIEGLEDVPMKGWEDVTYEGMGGRHL